ncbi:MAG: hypothetical protein HQM03_11440 [Magnetococcales bacterium]|nr:hypothetical protein [Magnetococcales bacterium]
MNTQSDGLKSNLQQVDAHVITPDEYEEIPELPPEFFTEGALYRHGQRIERRELQKAAGKIPKWIAHARS